MAKQIKVNLIEKDYSVFIGDDVLDLLVKRINSLKPDKCLVITDKNLFKHHSNLIRKYFSQLDCKTYHQNILVTERAKDIKSISKLSRYLINNLFSRDSIIVAVGGGITGDLCGFLASIYMRGIKFIQVPTTLLAMVDSAVGGKTGVNFENRKNILGTFYQPDSVFIFPDFLKTLPRKELICGAGEIFKYSFLTDQKKYLKLCNSVKKIFTFKEFDYIPVIKICLNIKSEIVSKDERETSGLRKILNLGHTFAHGFEAASEYKLSHGEAVIAGVYCALIASEKISYLDKNKLSRFLHDFDYILINDLIFDLDSRIVFNFMLSDKKNSKEKIKLVLIENIGNIVVDSIVTKSIVCESIELMKNHFRVTNRFKRGKLSGFEGET